MNPRMIMYRYILAVIAVSAIALVTISAQDKKPEAQGDAANMQEMMKRWQESATPGPAHKKLEPLVGTWDTVSRMWMQGPGKPPVESKGTAEIRWVLGGRFLLEEAKGEMMGQPFQGMGLTGYDNFKKKYIFSWADSSETALYTALGDIDSTGVVMTSYGQMDEPMTGERDKRVKYVTRMINQDKHVFEIYDNVGKPGEFVAVEITYTRRK